MSRNDFSDLGFIPRNNSNSATLDDLGFIPTKKNQPKDTISNLLNEDVKQAIIPKKPTAGEVFATEAVDKSLGLIPKIFKGKPNLSQGETKTISEHPIAKYLGDLVGGVGSASALAAIPGVGLPVAFGAAGALQEAGNQADKIDNPEFQPTALKLASQQALAGGAGATMGKIFNTPATGQIIPSIIKKNIIPSTVASRAAEQAIGAGATGLTSDIASQAIEGKKPDIKQALMNAGLNTAIYGLTTAATKFPELRDIVKQEGSRLAKKDLSFDEAKSIIEKAGINPEALSPEFVSAAYNAKKQDFIKNELKPKMKKYGASEDVVNGIIQDKDIRQREESLTNFMNSIAKSDPEQAQKLSPYFEQIKNGADPVDTLMMADLREKILAPLQKKIEQSVEVKQSKNGVDKQSVKDISDWLSGTTGPTLTRTLEGKVQRNASDWPPFLSNRKYTKVTLNKLFDKALSDQPLTENEKFRLNGIIKDYKEYTKPNEQPKQTTEEINKAWDESGQAQLPIQTLAKITKDVVNLISPTTMVPKKSLDSAMTMKGQQDKIEFVLERHMKGIEDAFEKMPQQHQIDFIDNIKRGLKQRTPELQAVADMLRQIEDNYWAEVKKYKPSLSYKDNHYRVLWKVIPGSGILQKGFKGLFKRPLQGTKGFMKQSTLQDMSEGLAKGGIPHSYNPITMWRNSIMDMQKFITAQRMWHELKDMGYIKFVKLGENAPDNFVKVDDSIGKVYFPVKEGLVNAGEHYVEENTGRILNNFLSKDLIRGSALGSSLLKFKNITTAIELAISPFHASYVSLAAMASNVGMGLQRIWNRGVLKAEPKEILKGLSNIVFAGTAPATLFKTASSGLKYYTQTGFKNSKLGQDFIKKYPNADELFDLLFVGGGKLAMHQDYKINSLKAFKEGIKNKEPWAMTISALPAVNEMLMKPLFEIYIPHLKVGAFLKEMSNELIQRSDQIQSGKLTKPELARQVWASIENRFGEMNFDNIFWNKTFKSAMQLVFRSVTWKIGALKNITGGTVGEFIEIKNAIEDRRMPMLNRDTGYLFGIALLVGLFSEIIMQLFLKKSPENLKDVVAPRYDKEGNRISLNTHLKDWIHLKHSPLNFVKNSLSGQIGKLIELWNNKDFYGVKVYNEDDPIMKKALDISKQQIPTPFSISNQTKLKSDEAPNILKGLVAAGIAQPTPSYITNTPALEKAYEINRAHFPIGGRTSEQKQHSDFKKQILIDINKTGKNDMLKQALKDGKITEKEGKEILSNVGKDPLEIAVKRMTYEDVVSVMEKANPEEIKKLLPIFLKKIDNKFKLLNEEDQKSLVEYSKEVLKKFKK